jgi:hypothetical protein
MASSTPLSNSVFDLGIAGDDSSNDPPLPSRFCLSCMSPATQDYMPSVVMNMIASGAIPLQVCNHVLPTNLNYSHESGSIVCVAQEGERDGLKRERGEGRWLV